MRLLPDLQPQSSYFEGEPLDPGEANSFRAAVVEAGLKPVVIHANYLINVASPKDETYEKSVSALTDELRRAEILGADCLVLHPGNHLGSGVEAGGSRRIASAIDRAYEDSGALVPICLENMAGAGTEIGVSFSELRSIIDISERGPISQDLPGHLPCLRGGRIQCRN